MTASVYPGILEVVLIVRSEMCSSSGGREDVDIVVGEEITSAGHFHAGALATRAKCEFFLKGFRYSPPKIKLDFQVQS